MLVALPWTNVMRIGIDAHILGKGAGGVERFLYEVVCRLPARMPQCHFVVFVGAGVAQELAMPAASNVEYVELASVNPLVERSVLMPWLRFRHRLDMLMIQRVAPWGCGQCQLVTVVHDITPLKYPDDYRGVTNMLVRLLTGSSVRRSALIFTPTQTIADEVARYFSQPAAKFRPFYNGVDGAQFRPGRAEGVPDYVFVAGAVEPRKNLEAIIRGFAEFRQEAHWQLRIAGKVRDEDYGRRMRDLVGELGVEKDVVWLGFMDEAALQAAYRDARVFVAASWDEGFNIPPLEALASGIPVLCSDIAVHRELFDGAALFFPPDAPTSLAQQLRRVAWDDTAVSGLLPAAKACVARLNWDATAERVADALQELINGT